MFYIVCLQITSYGSRLAYTITYEVDGSPSRPTGPDVILAVSPFSQHPFSPNPCRKKKHLGFKHYGENSNASIVTTTVPSNGNFQVVGSSMGFSFAMPFILKRIKRKTSFLWVHTVRYHWTKISTLLFLFTRCMFPLCTQGKGGGGGDQHVAEKPLRQRHANRGQNATKVMGFYFRYCDAQLILLKYAYTV